MTDEISVAVSELLGTTRAWFDDQAVRVPCRWCRGLDHPVDSCIWAKDREER